MHALRIQGRELPGKGEKDMKTLKIYVAGKVSPNSSFGTPFWRDEFCKELEKKSGVRIVNIDPTSRKTMSFDAEMVFGRDAFFIKSADLVIVNLTDDISIGGAQEMLIAKYFSRPLLGIARKGGKFVDPEKEEYGKKINFVHPFAHVPCDAIVNDMDEAANWIKKELPKIKKPKEIKCIDDSIKYYMKKYYQKDDFAKKTTGKK